MHRDKLDLFNLSLARQIAGFDEDELWEFFLEREEIMKELTDWDKPDRTYKFKFHSVLIHAYSHGKDHFRKMFLQFTEYQEEFDVVIYNAVEDFCFAHDYVKLGYFAVGGF